MMVHDLFYQDFQYSTSLIDDVSDGLSPHYHALWITELISSEDICKIVIRHPTDLSQREYQ